MVAPLVPPLVHTAPVRDENVTASPDVAEAETPTGDCTMVAFATAPNVMLWLAFETVKLCCTGGAALNAAFPACAAWIVHVPGATSVMDAPLVPPAVQTALVSDVNVTARPDDAVAETVTGDCNNVAF